MFGIEDDGKETVSEYVEKRKEEREAAKEQENENKVAKGDKDEETIKTVVQAVPHVATFALGGLAGSTLAPLIEEYRKLKGKADKLKGKK